MMVLRRLTQGKAQREMRQNPWKKAASQNEFPAALRRRKQGNSQGVTTPKGCQPRRVTKMGRGNQEAGLEEQHHETLHHHPKTARISSDRMVPEEGTRGELRRQLREICPLPGRPRSQILNNRSREGQLQPNLATEDQGLGLKAGVKAGVNMVAKLSPCPFLKAKVP